MPTPQALGRARLRERALRVARIRRTILVATLAAFVLAWGVIAFDGPMGRAGATSAGAAGSTSASSSGDAFVPGDAPSSSSAGPPAVTTSQS